MLLWFCGVISHEIWVTVQGFLMNIHEIFIFILFLAQITITMKLQFMTMKVYCNVDSIILNIAVAN